MYIRQMFAQKPCVFSIECFPPKQVENYEKMQKTLLRMGQLHPDFIILDINMPVMNGLEAARIITNEKLAGFVMLLTAYRDREITEKISSLDVMGYLVKPVDEYSLIPAIRIALNKYHQLAHIEQEYAKTKEALDGRKYLDRAKGMIMETQHLSEHDAYAYLRKLAMDKGLSLTELSRLLLQAHNE